VIIRSSAEVQVRQTRFERFGQVRFNPIQNARVRGGTCNASGRFPRSQFAYDGMVGATSRLVDSLSNFPTRGVDSIERPIARALTPKYRSIIEFALVLRGRPVWGATKRPE
jgi:hypothetical protein